MQNIKVEVETHSYTNAFTPDMRVYFQCGKCAHLTEEAIYLGCHAVYQTPRIIVDQITPDAVVMQISAVCEKCGSEANVIDPEITTITDEDIERDVFGITPDDSQSIDEDDFFDDLDVEGEKCLLHK